MSLYCTSRERGESETAIQECPVQLSLASGIHSAGPDLVPSKRAVTQVRERLSFLAKRAVTQVGERLSSNVSLDLQMTQVRERLSFLAMSP